MLASVILAVVTAPSCILTVVTALDPNSAAVTFPSIILVLETESAASLPATIPALAIIAP